VRPALFHWYKTNSMKKILFLSLISFSLFSCEKNKNSTSFNNSNSNGTLKADFSYQVIQPVLPNGNVVFTDRSTGATSVEFTINNSHWPTNVYATSKRDFEYSNMCGCDMTVTLVASNGTSRDTIVKTISMQQINLKIIEAEVYRYTSAPGQINYQLEEVQVGDNTSLYLYNTYTDMENMTNPVGGPFVTDSTGRYNLINFTPGAYFIRGIRNGIMSNIYLAATDNIITLSSDDCYFQENKIEIIVP
jgi:hypothetical protein